MLQQSYGIKRISGMGVGLVTFLSVASVSSNALNASVTAGINNIYAYEGVALVNDNEGTMCVSASIPTESDKHIKNMDEIDIINARSKKKVELEVTKISKHISQFDFEDEYEEI